MLNQLETLRFAAREGVQWLTKAQIAKADLLQQTERSGQRVSFTQRREKLNGLTDGQLQNLMNGATLEFHLQHVRLETLPFAFRAAHIKVAQELHLDFFKTGPAAALATAAPGIERK